MVQDSPSRKLDQYIVRFPDGMRDELKETAKDNNRSLNAEIIERLQNYNRLNDKYLELENIFLEFRDRMIQAEDKNALLEREVKINNDTIEYLEKIRGELEERLEMAEENNFSYIALPNDQTMYVLLDVDGYPTSWQEIMMNISAIEDKLEKQVDKIEVTVFDANIKSNKDRDQDWLNLYKKYKNKDD